MSDKQTADAVREAYRQGQIDMRERAAQVCDQRGAEEQEGFGLVRGTQNYFRARNAVSDLEIAALDSRAGDAGEPVAWQWERRGRYGPTDGATIGKWERVLTPYAPDTWPEADRRNIVPLYAATPAPAVDAVPAGEVVERLKETAEDLRKIGWHKDRQNVLDAIASLSHGEGRK